MKYLLIIIIVAVLGVSSGYFLGKEKSVMEDESGTETLQEEQSTAGLPEVRPSPIEDSSPVLPQKESKKQSPKIQPTPTLTPLPTPALEVRLLFANCTPSPSSLHLKADTRFIIENTDATSRKIAIGGNQTFIVTPHTAVYAYARPLGILSITCDGLGVGTVFVE